MLLVKPFSFIVVGVMLYHKNQNNILVRKERRRVALRGVAHVYGNSSIIMTGVTLSVPEYYGCDTYNFTRVLLNCLFLYFIHSKQEFLTPFPA